MKRHILRWTLIGLLIRFLIMPFSFHGDDIFFIYYGPFKFIEQGAWNPYLFFKGNFPHVDNPYFPPLTFFIISIFLFLFKPFLPSLRDLFSSYESTAFTWGGNTINYADILVDNQLFRALFIFKIPYLIFDFGTAWFLFQILKSDTKKSLFAYKIWMLNPFVLHSCYALGQVDIIMAFFVMAAIYCISLNKRYWAMISLASAVLIKVFPIILVPFAILLLGATLKDKFKLSLVFVLATVAIVLPFYISSSNSLIEALFFSPGNIPHFRQAFFIGGYLLMVSLFLFVEKRNVDLDLIVTSFILALLLFYSLYTVTIRYFIVITPLLIYIALKNKRYWLYITIFFITLFALRTAGNSQQWGLFAAVHPEFFSSLPILDSYLNLAINVKHIHQLMYRLFFASSLIMIMHILIVKRKLFKFPISLRKK